MDCILRLKAQTKNTPLKSSRFFTLNSTKILSPEAYKQALLGVILVSSVCIGTSWVSISHKTQMAVRYV